MPPRRGRHRASPYFPRRGLAHPNQHTTHRERHTVTLHIDADVKFDSKVLTDVAEALEPHATDMFKQRAGRWMAVVEFGHVERTEPGPDEDKNPTVKIRVTSIEVAADEVTRGRLRGVQREMYDRRTSGGTLFEQHDDEVA